MVGSGPSKKCDVERVEEEKKTARAERSPLHIAKPETRFLETLCDLLHMDKTRRPLTKIPDFFPKTTAPRSKNTWSRHRDVERLITEPEPRGVGASAG
jgi:hypothetical protein